MTTVSSSHPPRSGNDRYRLFWRWHLYAGLFVAPFLVMLAVTGAIYLFNDEINDALYPQMRLAPAPWTARAPLGRMIDGAESTAPGAIATRIDVPADTRRAAQVHLALPAGQTRIAFVNPADASLLGVLDPARTLVGMADRLHGSLMIGEPGSYVVELAACWAVLLILSGLYLGWPRGGGHRWWHALVPDVHARERALLKSLHVAVGAWVSLLVLFLIFTGPPWASFWGGWIRGGAELIGEGYPAVYRRYAPATQPATVIGDGFIDVPWTLQQAPLPPAPPPATSAAHHDHHGTTSAAAGAARLWTDAGLERAYAHAHAAMPGEELRMFLPGGARSSLMTYTYPARPQQQVTWHFGGDGALLVSTGFVDYGRVAQAIELGVQLHMGNYFGRANQIVMLLACIGVVVMVVSGVLMWWKRRPGGRIGAPRVQRPPPRWALLVLLLMSAAVLPLLAISLVAVLVFDTWLRPRLPGLRWLE